MKKNKTLTILTLILLLILAIAPGAAAESAEPAPAIDLTGILEAVLALLCSLITHRLLPWIKANTTQKQQAAVEAATRTAVYAAEQLYATGVIDDRLDYATRWLKRQGFEADRASVEAAVNQMKNALIAPVVIGMEEGAVNE